MRIKSDYREFYDFGQSYDTDRTTLYLRKTIDLPNLKNSNIPIPNSLAYYKGGYDYHGFVIFFAGTWYPGIMKCDHESILKLIYDPDYISGMYKDYYDWKSRSYYSAGSRFIKYFASPDDTLKELGEKYGPVFILKTSRQTPRDEIEITQNPYLGTYQFHAVLQGHLAYDALYRWFCNRGTNKPIPEMDNDTKILQHGFDLKHSFRRDKQ